jgi:hypothetical protein
MEEVAMNRCLRQGAMVGAAPFVRGQRARIALPGDQGVHDRPTSDAVQVRQHRRDLDLGVLEQLFHPLLLAGAVLYQSVLMTPT